MTRVLSEQRETLNNRIIVISQVPPPVHGSTVMTSYFCRTLQDLGFDITLVDRRFSSSVSEVGRVSVKKVFSGLWLLVRLAATLIRARPSVCVHFVTNRPASFLLDVAMAQLIAGAKVRHLAYVHTSGYRQLAARNSTWSRLVRLLFARTSRAVCLGPTLVADITPWVNPSDVSIVPNMTAPAPKQTIRRALRGRPRLLFISNLSRAKGVFDFLELARRVSAAIPTATFDIAGAEGDLAVLEDLTALIDEYSMAERIRLHGPAGDELKARLFAQSSVLIFPSVYQYEAQPLTIVEAMSFGLPVVAYDTGGIRDLVATDINGMLVPAGSLSGMTDAVLKLLQDERLQTKLSQGAKARWAAHHSPESYAARWAQLL